MSALLTSALPMHQAFIQNLVSLISADGRFSGISLSGSGSEDKLDRYSDLDFVLAIQPQHVEEVMAQRKEIAGSLGKLLVSFTGEHVGEPRLLICLYESDEVLHIDLKFVSAEDVGERVDRPLILWEEQDCLSREYTHESSGYPIQPLQWYEDRIWVWIHYGASKAGRGELFEAIELLSFFRQAVLGPLFMLANGMEPVGVRKIELLLPDVAEKLQSTLAQYNKASVLTSLDNVADLYCQAREILKTQQLFVEQTVAEKSVMEYLSGELEQISK